jgi:quercetin dioxygenase-like cupin family protein
MESYRLLSDLEFHDGDPFAQPILVDKDVRILRWLLKPGQVIRDHAAPGSPFYAVILKGRGMFAGPDGEEVEHGVGALLTFAPGETHSVRAVDEELVFVGFLQGVEAMRPDHAGGVLGRT